MEILHNNSFAANLIQSLEMTIIGGDWQVYDSNWGGQGVNDPFARLYYVQKGHGLVRFNDQQKKPVHLRPGSLFLFPPNKGADYGCEDDFELMWVHLTLQTLVMLDLFSILVLPVEVKLEGEEKDLSRLFGTMLSARASETAAGWLQANGLVRYFFAFFLANARTRGKAESEDFERVRSVLVFMRSHLDKPLQLSDLARRVGLHPTYFSNLFSRTLGTPPMHYLAHLRIRTAQELLRFTTLTIHEIAMRTGFSDPLYFSRCFKRKTGFTPTRYRSFDNNF